MMSPSTCMHLTTKHDSVNIPITCTIPSCVTAKPPPMTEVKYPNIGKEENFLQYILCCGGTSTQSAGLVLSRVFKNHPHAFVNNDVALVHVVELIIFATALSHRFRHILSYMIEKNGKHPVAYFGVKIARFMDICVCGESRGVLEKDHSPIASCWFSPMSSLAFFWILRRS